MQRKIERRRSNITINQVYEFGSHVLEHCINVNRDSPYNRHGLTLLNLSAFHARWQSADQYAKSALSGSSPSMSKVLIIPCCV